MKILVKTAFCIVLFVIFCASKDTSEPEIRPLKKEISISCVLYEFHPGYITISNAFFLKNSSALSAPMSEKRDSTIDSNAVSSLPYTLAFPDVYDSSDFAVEQVSSNISRFAPFWNTIQWRGETLYSLSVKWMPKSPDTSSYYWIQGITRRLPHLHTRDALSPGREFDFGCNARFGNSQTIDSRALAFPKETKIIETFGRMPTRRMTYGDWQLLLYTMEQKSTGSFHVKFILPAKDISAISIGPFLSRITAGILDNPTDTAQ